LPLCARFGIDAATIRRQRAFLRFTPQDDAHLEIIHRVIAADVDAIVTEFYTHLQQFPELATFLADPQLRDRLKLTQRRYLLDLGRRADQPAYFEDRLRIGMAHERVGLELEWYLGAYATLFERIEARLTVHCTDRPERLAGLLTTLHKIFTLDSLLAVETYYRATTERLRTLLQELSAARQELIEQSQTDALTQVHNRMFLLEVLEKELQRSQRFRHPFSLLFVDLDHFKQVNDRCGHRFGDLALQTVADTMRGVLRPADILGRLGGEEFLVGLVETGPAAARQIAERLRQTVAAKRIEAHGQCVAVTVSVGVASATDPTVCLQTLIDQADQALYRAKQSGRNRVCGVAE
jgi:diguanylate cyclase (GGDEF)-like protein